VTAETFQMETKTLQSTVATLRADVLRKDETINELGEYRHGVAVMIVAVRAP